MTNIDEYCHLVHEGAGFDDARLAELRESMTPEEVQRVRVRLRQEAYAGLEAEEALGEWYFQRRFPDAIVVDDDFGGCPVCGKTDGYLNIGRDHWFVCHAHEKRWLIGSNLFSGWKEETEAKWAANAALLEGYEKIEPLSMGRWPRDQVDRLIVRAELDPELAEFLGRRRGVGVESAARRFDP
jgi:hypothetical protein